jgi:hypothetical protein
MKLNQDVVKVNAVNITALVTAFELADVQMLLSIAVLAVSLLYTCFKFYKEVKEPKK